MKLPRYGTMRTIPLLVCLLLAGIPVFAGDEPQPGARQVESGRLQEHSLHLQQEQHDVGGWRKLRDELDRIERDQRQEAKPKKRGK